VAIRGKADRVDVLGDGSLRVVDYKLGRMPDLATSIQVAVYAYCARQMVEARGGVHPIAGAAYLAFGDDRGLEGSIGRGVPEKVTAAVMTRVSEFAATIDEIEAGQFPPRPKRPSDCQWCAFRGVCRKEYRLEEVDPSTDAV
jgi:RecB family exonuclease